MTARKVIHVKHLPARLPLFQTLVAWLMLDRFQAPGWVWGVVGTFFALVWIGTVISMATQKCHKPIFGDPE